MQENRNYLNYVENILNNGVTKSDRTGTGTVSLKGQAITFDLQEGFPLETSKMVSLDNIDKELRWFWRGDTSQRTLKKAGCNIWNDWADNQGRLGPVYGAMWRRRPVGFVEYLYKERVNANPNVQAISAQEFFGLPENVQPRGRTELRRFVDAFIENQDADTKILLEQYTAAAKGWRHVVRNLAVRAFEHGLSVNIDKRWVTFENFLDDFSTMAGNELVDIYPIGNEPAMAVMVYVLNHYANGQFDKHSVQFVRQEYALFVDKAMIALQKTQPNSRTVLDAIFYVDQFAEVEALLAEHSNSRRIIVDGWEPSLLPLDHAKPHQQAGFGRQALPPCHTLFQFYVDPTDKEDVKKLSLSLYQRSWDTVLGAPYNIASYALMVHYLANKYDMEVGTLSIMGGDCHIYLNHTEKLKEQLQEKTYPFPKLKIHGKVTDLANLDGITLELENYQHGPVYRYPVAV